MADNTVLNVGTGGDTVRDLARQAGTVKTQVVQLDLGGASANAEVLISAGQKTMALSVPVVLASDQSALPVTGAFYQATQPVSIAATINVSTGLVQAATDTQMRASALPVLQAALTKGTQGGQGVTVQDLKDAGRSRVAIVFQAVAPAVADTLLSLVKMNAGVAAAGATSIGVTSGKILRITAITLSLKSGAAAAAFATLTLRTNPTGATLISSPSEVRLDVGTTGATIGAADKVEIIFPDGLEFSGTQTIGISLAAQAVTNIVSIGLNGFEY